MKKVLCFLLLIGIGIIDSPTVEAKSVAKSTTISANNNDTIARNRRRANRQRRGFMWGLFKKKNSCGCPSH